jgi:hypothetical protein
MAKPDETLATPTRFADFAAFPNVKIAFPTFEQWRFLKDPNNRHDPQSQQRRFQREGDDHCNEMTDLLTRVARSTLGKAVLNEFSFRPENNAYIFPWEFYRPQKGKGDTSGATVTLKAQNRFLGSVVCDADRKGPYKCVLSVGAGTLCYVFVSSDDSPDETLTHELVHAGRISRGVFNEQPMQGVAPNTEDFLANLVENMYRMAVKNGSLQAYAGRIFDINTYLTSQTRPGPRDVLSLFRQGQRSLYDVLLHCHTRYNSIAQYDRELRAQAAHPEAHLTQSG